MTMRRTRKWAYVEQEARRLADLGLSGYALAKHLGVSEASVSRWVKAGKLTLKGGKSAEREANRAEVEASGSQKSPDQWAASVRAEYQLDATDEVLVAMAEAAKLKALDEGIGVSARLQAMGRFQALVRQLALVTRKRDQEPTPAAPPPEEPKKRVVERRTGTDPRVLLMPVKP
jgi:transposase